MIVLDEPYVSEPLVVWLEKSQHPVLDNETARRIAGTRDLNLVTSEEAIERIDAGERVYTNSENALAWITENVRNERIVHAVNLFKDKSLMRSTLSSLDPDLFYRTCSIDELFKLDFSRLQTPFVLKPSVGFCSVGVYAIKSREDWERALADIQNNASSWHDRYPDSVVGMGSFILEGYVGGREYALDAYYDESGQARILNVLRHDFSSQDDTSDRMYLTSASIVRENVALFTTWLNRVNALVGARNFPMHVEVRVEDGHVCPIEFNPLRFAGLCGTDVSYYAYGYRTYEAFLDDRQPDFNTVFSGKEDKVYTMSLLSPPRGATGEERFDYDAFCERFSHVIEMRRFDVKHVGTYGFLFLEADAATKDELAFLRTSDLWEFLR